MRALECSRPEPWVAAILCVRVCVPGWSLADGLRWGLAFGACLFCCCSTVGGGGGGVGGFPPISVVQLASERPGALGSGDAKHDG